MLSHMSLILGAQSPRINHLRSLCHCWVHPLSNMVACLHEISLHGRANLVTFKVIYIPEDRYSTCQPWDRYSMIEGVGLRHLSFTLQQMTSKVAKMFQLGLSWGPRPLLSR